jgi:hypothetical protein
VSASSVKTCSAHCWGAGGTACSEGLGFGEMRSDGSERQNNGSVSKQHKHMCSALLGLALHALGLGVGGYGTTAVTAEKQQCQKHGHMYSAMLGRRWHGMPWGWGFARARFHDRRREHYR